MHTPVRQCPGLNRSNEQCTAEAKHVRTCPFLALLNAETFFVNIAGTNINNFSLRYR